MMRVFRLFIGIQLLIITSEDQQQEMVLNLNPTRIKVINLFGATARYIYGLGNKFDQYATKN